MWIIASVIFYVNYLLFIRNYCEAQLLKITHLLLSLFRIRHNLGRSSDSGFPPKISYSRSQPGLGCHLEGFSGKGSTSEPMWLVLGFICFQGVELRASAAVCWLETALTSLPHGSLQHGSLLYQRMQAEKAVERVVAR